MTSAVRPADADADWPPGFAVEQPLSSVPASLLILAEWTGGRTGRTLRAIARRQLPLVADALEHGAVDDAERHYAAMLRDQSALVTDRLRANGALCGDEPDEED